MEKIILLINFSFICLCVCLAMYGFTINILKEAFNKKCLLLFYPVFTAIQICVNLALPQITTDYIVLTGIISAFYHFGLFSFHVVFLTILIVRIHNTLPAETLTAVALGHFVNSTVISMVDEWMILRVSEDIFIYVYVLLVVTSPHLIGLAATILVSKFLNRYQFYKYYQALFANRIRKIITVAASLLLMNIYALATLLLPVDRGGLPTTIYMALFIVFALFVLQFAAMHNADREVIKAHEETIGQQQAHLKLLEELQQEMRTFRHDFSNLMTGLSEQTREGDLKGVKTFLMGTNSYFDDRLGNEIKYLENVSNIQILPLRSLITSKIMSMQAAGITGHLEVQNSVSKLGMRLEDLLRCVGILLDNAIEASPKSQAGQIHMIVLQRSDEFYLAVANTFERKPDLMQMQTNGYTTKGIRRGTGLRGLRRITGGYQNCMMQTSMKEDMLLQEIRMKL